MKTSFSVYRVTWALISLIFFLGGTRSVTASEPVTPPLKTVEKVDLKRYLGRWYEIASYPQRFQKGCVATIATYQPHKNGKDIEVINECRMNTLDGKIKVAKGKAWVVNPVSNAELAVQFFWPFYGDYWIIELGANYEYAVVGHPDREYLWILSRTPQMPSETYQMIIERLEKTHYYDTKLLLKTLQPE